MFNSGIFYQRSINASFSDSFLSKYEENIFYSSLHIPQWLTTVSYSEIDIQQKSKHLYYIEYEILSKYGFNALDK